MLLMMLLTATTAGAQEAISGLTYNSTGGYYEINDKQDLIDLATYVNAGNTASGKWFKQTADLNMSGVTWTAIGTKVGDSEFRRFYGNYDGNCKGLEQFNINHDGAVTLGNSNAFEGCDALQYIIFSTPAGVLANTSGNWSGFATKLRVALGSYLFTATNEGGTPAYKIANGDDLRRLATAVEATDNYASTDKTFRQTANIDLDSNDNFTPIGAPGADASFCGTYDGGKHTISGLSVSKERGYIGLFGMVRGATVRNVTLVSPTLTATTTQDYNVRIGAVIGSCDNGANNVVENCHVISPNVSSSSTSNINYVGAIIGDIHDTNTTVTNCYYYGGNATAAYGFKENGAPVTNVGRATR